MDGHFLSIDWGTTNRRVYSIDAGGAVIETERDDRGVLAIAPGGFDAEAASIRARFGDAPMLCAGMVGSKRGWHEIPYVPAPADFAAIARGTQWIDARRTAIVPGVCRLDDSRADVMRGEEVQFLGALEAGLVPDGAMLCQPGTHCKWARVAGGRLVDFTTTMTGELFALLKQHSLLADLLDGDVGPNDGFLAGVRQAQGQDLLSLLFSVRAARLLGSLPLEQSASFTSGLLIGSDVRARFTDPSEPVHVLADAHLGGLYRCAIEELGGSAILVDSHAAFVAGITRIWREL